MHGLQEIIYANANAARQAKAQALKRRNATAHQKIEALAYIRAYASEYPTLTPAQLQEVANVSKYN